MINKRIWFSCWMFGAILALLSFIIALNSTDRYMMFVGIFFLGIHVVGIIKYVKPFS